MLDLGSPYNKIPRKLILGILLGVPVFIYHGGVIMIVRSDLRETFDSGNWALAPSKDVLEMIAAKTFTLGCSPKPWPEYTDVSHTPTTTLTTKTHFYLVDS